MISRACGNPVSFIWLKIYSPMPMSYTCKIMGLLGALLGIKLSKYSCAAWHTDYIILFCLFGFEILHPSQQLWSC